MMDLAITEENNNGGDLILIGNDLAMVFGIENMPYLAMFGGNPGFPTKNKVVEEQSFDWWGNNLLMAGNQSIQLNSLTELTLRKVALNSSGRIQIEEAIKKDLEFLSAFATVTVSASIVSLDHIRIEIKILQNDGLSSVKIINLRKTLDGDFSISDFNNDFFI
jgi:hypothetical protein